MSGCGLSYRAHNQLAVHLAVGLHGTAAGVAVVVAGMMTGRIGIFVLGSEVKRDQLAETLWLPQKVFLNFERRKKSHHYSSFPELCFHGRFVDFRLLCPHSVPEFLVIFRSQMDCQDSL